MVTEREPAKHRAQVVQALHAPSPAEEVANRAARAYWSWSITPPETRCRHLETMAVRLGEERGRLAKIAAREIGTAPKWVDFNIEIAQQMLRCAGDLIPLMQDQEIIDPKRGTRSILKRQSVGVVLGFAPWNAPIALAVRAIAGPLACGNAVVLKASEHCPKTQGAVIDILNDSGLPDGVASVVQNGLDESETVTRTLIAHPAIRRINFTGSTRVGRIVAGMAARELKRCLLELSGKAPLLVLVDADLDAAVAAAAHGSFFNQGQICMSTERIIVVDDVADAFVDKLVEKTRSLHAADPSVSSAPLGRLINDQAAARVRGLIDDAIARGADLLIGGEVEGAVMQPAVVDHLSSSMRLYHEESFGPVAAVLRVADTEEAISIANDTEFGLSSAIFGGDIERCMDVAARLETGICQINGPTVYDDAPMPFGGMKSSGYGRFGGPASIDEFTELRWIAEHEVDDPARLEKQLT
ncbi:MAG: aldehyde dehydrogenase family protein [Pseudomonadota bacterium]